MCGYKYLCPVDCSVYPSGHLPRSNTAWFVLHMISWTCSVPHYSASHLHVHVHSIVSVMSHCLLLYLFCISVMYSVSGEIFCFSFMLFRLVFSNVKKTNSNPALPPHQCLDCPWHFHIFFAFLSCSFTVFSCNRKSWEIIVGFLELVIWPLICIFFFGPWWPDATASLWTA